MSRRKRTVAVFMEDAAARTALYEQHLGRDIVGRLAHHQRQMQEHYDHYAVELARLQEACRDVGITLPALGTGG